MKDRMIAGIFIAMIAMCGITEGAERKTKLDAKTQDIMDLARLFVLQMDPALTSAVQASIKIMKSDINVEKAISVVRERMGSAEVLKKVAQSIDKVFTHEETKLLITFYESEAVKKMNKTAPETFAPISVAMQEIIKDVISPQALADKVVLLTQLNYQKELKEFRGNALVEVYSTFCGPCQIVAPIFSEVSNELGDKIKFLKLDIVSDPNLAKELDIHGIPTLLFIKEGKIIDRHVGPVNKNDFVTKIKEKLF